jgi:hypothetical protein
METKEMERKRALVVACTGEAFPKDEDWGTFVNYMNILEWEANPQEYCCTIEAGLDKLSDEQGPFTTEAIMIAGKEVRRSPSELSGKYDALFLIADTEEPGAKYYEVLRKEVLPLTASRLPVFKYDPTDKAFYEQCTDCVQKELDAYEKFSKN